jgi:hypothetical protein
MNDTGEKLSARVKPFYHLIWGKDVEEITLDPMTPIPGHQRRVFIN